VQTIRFCNIPESSSKLKRLWKRLDPETETLELNTLRERNKTISETCKIWFSIGFT
jgi:hypothetical protein